MKPSNKIFVYHEENGIFISFCGYTFEDDFPAFLDFLKEKLCVTDVGQTQVIIYLIITELLVDNKIIRAVFDEQLGCMIRLEPDWNDFADEIVKRCTV